MPHVRVLSSRIQALKVSFQSSKILLGQFHACVYCIVIMSTAINMKYPLPFPLNPITNGPLVAIPWKKMVSPPKAPCSQEL